MQQTFEDPIGSEAFLSLVVIVVELSPYSLGQAAVKVGPMIELNWSFCIILWALRNNGIAPESIPQAFLLLLGHASLQSLWASSRIENMSKIIKNM